jgi:hypothetical protein
MAYTARSATGSARLLFMVLAAMLLATGGAHAQGQGPRTTVVIGRVVDDATEQAIAGARVKLLRESGALIRSTVTNPDGFFRFELADGGWHRLSADRIGFQEAVTPVFSAERRQETTVEIRLATDAILLAPLEIVARRSAQGNPTLSGFYYRMNRGLGYFISREDIALRGASHVADLLAAAPGVRILRARRGGGWTVYMGRALPAVGGCPTQVFIDGMLMNRRLASVNRDASGQPVSVDFLEDVDFSIDELVSPTIIEGIEVYNGLSGVPAEFVNTDSRCGVVLIWTRRGV